MTARMLLAGLFAAALTLTSPADTSNWELWAAGIHPADCPTVQAVG